MGFKVGFSGVPVSLKFFTKKSNPKILKQWQDLDKKKREQREEKNLREVKKTQRVKPKPKNTRPVKRAQTTGKGRK